VVCQEVFGPVASIIPYSTFDEAIDAVMILNMVYKQASLQIM